jgi:hypothetical protein
LVELIDLNGKTISSFNSNSNSILQKNNLPRGIYLLRVIDGNQVTSKKVIVY